MSKLIEIKGKEVAEIMCVSEERVSQIKGDGLIRLGIRLRNKGIVER